MSSGAMLETRAWKTGATIISPTVITAIASMKKPYVAVKPYMANPMAYSSVPIAIINMGGRFSIRRVIGNWNRTTMAAFRLISSP